MKVKVPDIPGPTYPLCWKAARNMTRCDRRKDHLGPHSWEAVDTIENLKDVIHILTMREKQAEV